MSIPVHFAPLQGYTDRVYREVHAAVFGGIETYYTPFVRLEKEGFRNKELRDIAPDGNRQALAVPQLIAATADEFRRIATLFGELGYCRADLNLGCPFPMQARLHRGAGILPYRDETERLLQVIHEFPTFRFSVKMRLGWDSPDEAQALLPLLNQLPLTHLTLHPRIGRQQYKGTTDLDAFGRFYESCTLPLFYNGDLNTLSDIDSVIERFPTLQGGMMGRGLLSHPWLAAEYGAGCALSACELRNKLRTFHQALTEGYAAVLEGGDHQLLGKLKTIWDYLLPDAEKRLHKKIAKSTSLIGYQKEVQALIDAYPAPQS